MSADTTETTIRAWFDAGGWHVPPGRLRAHLEKLGATADLTIELLDQAADLKRAAAAEDTRRKAAPATNGNGPPIPSPAPAPGAIPPQNLEAEESVLGAMMISPLAIAAVSKIVDPDDFYRESHGKIYRAALDLYSKNEPVDAITLTNELEQRGELDQVGGRVRLHELSIIVPASANAAHYAAIVRETATLRGLIRGGGEIAQLGWGREGEPADLVARAEQLVVELRERATSTDEDRLVGGGDFILDTPTDQQAVWGDDKTGTGWAQGEGLVIVGPQGVGKTTLAQQLALGRAGLQTRVLEMPVTPDERAVLYIAADRPRQAARSFHRMVGEHNRDHLNDRLHIWAGPLPFLLSEQPTGLARLCERHNVGTVFLDSIKDFVGKPSDEEHANRFNMAVQHCLANGIEVVALHHQRKEQRGTGKPTSLADVYGNTFLTAGMGSVILLWGEPGDAIVELKHLKQPADEVGPFNIRHDHVRGYTLKHEAVSLEDILRRAAATGVTTRQVAGLIFQTDTPDQNDEARARRRLLRLVEHGHAREQEPPPGDLAGQTRWHPATTLKGHA